MFSVYWLFQLFPLWRLFFMYLLASFFFQSYLCMTQLLTGFSSSLPSNFMIFNFCILFHYIMQHGTHHKIKHSFFRTIYPIIFRSHIAVDYLLFYCQQDNLLMKFSLLPLCFFVSVVSSRIPQVKTSPRLYRDSLD